MKLTRRTFLRSVVGTPLAAGCSSIGSLTVFRRPASWNPLASLIAEEPALFPQPQAIRYDSHCFTIHERDTFLFGASFHYPRCPRELWRDRLIKLQRAGFNTIETYVFWNYHEPEEGHLDLIGFEDFVKLVGEMGFWMIARPGPYVCAEWDAGGFPPWVIAKRFALRSNDSESIRTSQHWFDEVLPVIRRHQITQGGPIILMQIENEYDYWQLADSAKRDYVDALAHMAWKTGIDVPLITCWTKQVREHSNPDMARIADFCNFYPRWNIDEEVLPALAKLRSEETASPQGVVELQGGWFSENAGKLSVEQNGIDAAQLNRLSKTVIEQGVTYFNYYMGFGGTNFDWGAKKMTTSYDYAAPLREPGGLWEKYYAARGVGESLRLFGNLLTRADGRPGAAQSDNPAVSTSLRMNGPSGVLFMHEKGNAEQRYKLTFQDPGGPSGVLTTVPRQGQLVIGAREMKMCPVRIPIGGTQLRYTTAEVLTHGKAARPYLILYDDPGRLVEFSISSTAEPRIEGETLYHYWDQRQQSVVIGVHVADVEALLLVNGQLQVVLLPRELALRTWAVSYPHLQVSAGREVPDAATPSILLISDSTLLWDSGHDANGVWADLDFRPGQHDLTALLPGRPTHCSLDGQPAAFQHDSDWQSARLQVKAPELPFKPIELTDLETWVERFDPHSGDWTKTNLRPLEELGLIPYGYVKYRSEFPYNGQSKLVLSTFADDAYKLFVNGKPIAPSFSKDREAEFALAGYAKAGNNALEIAYELFGSPNFGRDIAELKGVESAKLMSAGKKAVDIGNWRVQRFPAATRGRGIDPSFAVSAWKKAKIESESAPELFAPTFTWCRASFGLQKSSEKWSVPWKAEFESNRDALLYLNGNFVGRYLTVGPQTEFYLPEPFLVFDQERSNILTIVLSYSEDARPIHTLRIAPYEEFATYRVRVGFQW